MTQIVKTQINQIARAFAVVYGGTRFNEPYQIKGIIDLAIQGRLSRVQLNKDMHGRHVAYVY